MTPTNPLIGHDLKRCELGCLARGYAFSLCSNGIGHPGEKSRVTGHVLQNFSKEDIEWLRPLVGAMVEAAPLLAADDDAGFMSKVAVLLAPPKPKKKDVE